MKKKTKRNYAPEFKEEAVKLITEQGYTFAEAGRNLGVNPNLISKWKKEIEGVSGIEFITSQCRIHSVRTKTP